MNNAINAAIHSKPFLLISEVAIAINAQKMMTELLSSHTPDPRIAEAYKALAAKTGLSVAGLQTIWEQGLQEICTVVAAMNMDAIAANKNSEQSLVPNSKLRETKVVIMAMDDEFPADAIQAGRYASMVVSHLSMRVQQAGKGVAPNNYRLQAAIQRQAGFSSVINNYVAITSAEHNTIHVMPLPADFVLEDIPRATYARRDMTMALMPSDVSSVGEDGVQSAIGGEGSY